MTGNGVGCAIDALDNTAIGQLIARLSDTVDAKINALTHFQYAHLVCRHLAFKTHAAWVNDLNQLFANLRCIACRGLACTDHTRKGSANFGTFELLLGRCRTRFARHEFALGTVALHFGFFKALHGHHALRLQRFDALVLALCTIQ